MQHNRPQGTRRPLLRISARPRSGRRPGLYDEEDVERLQGALRLKVLLGVALEEELQEKRHRIRARLAEAASPVGA